MPLGRYFAAASRTLCGIGGPEFESTWIAEPRFLLTCSKSPRRRSMVALSCTWFKRMPRTAPSSMAWPPPWAWTVHPRQNRCQSDLSGMRKGRLTRKHGMSSIANQKKKVFAPRRYRVSGNQFPEFDLSGFPERRKLICREAACRGVKTHARTACRAGLNSFFAYSIIMVGSMPAWKSTSERRYQGMLVTRVGCTYLL